MTSNARAYQDPGSPRPTRPREAFAQRRHELSPQRTAIGDERNQTTPVLKVEHGSAQARLEHVDLHVCAPSATGTAPGAEATSSGTPAPDAP